MRLAGKVAIITGGGSGIGEATVLRFVREGARVALVDRDAAGGARVAASAGEAAVFIQGDVTSASDMAALAATVVNRFGRIDILFNNAGISCVGTLHETAEEDWDRVMAVNAKGVYLPSRYVVPIMMAQQSGSIINMASGAAVMGLAERAAYSAAKGAVLSLTRAMQADYARFGIRVNALVPGTIYTPFVEGYLRRHYADNLEQAMANLRRRQLSNTLGSPADVAAAALYLASDEAAFVLGSALTVDGGFSSAKVF